jgi:Na+/proline symporter
VPYIALQLKAISGSVSLMVEHYTGAPPSFDPFVSDISLIVAMLLALFAVLFGTRHADATEHQDGLVLAVASNRGQARGVPRGRAPSSPSCCSAAPAPHVRQAFAANAAVEAIRAIPPRSAHGWCSPPQRLRHHHAAAPVLRHDRREPQRQRTAHATWLFPLYLVAINLFVLPIAFAGLALVGASTSSDLYVLSVPLLGGHDLLAMIAFIGGLSAATAMVIVESVALSIMISNDLVIPIFVRRCSSPSLGNEDWSR